MIRGVVLEHPLPRSWHTGAFRDKVGAYRACDGVREGWRTMVQKDRSMRVSRQVQQRLRRANLSSVALIIISEIVPANVRAQHASAIFR